MSLLKYLQDENILDSFLINRKHPGLPYSIGSSFSWDKTPEGIMFWCNHHDSCAESFTKEELAYLKEIFPEYMI